MENGAVLERKDKMPDLGEYGRDDADLGSMHAAVKENLQIDSYNCNSAESSSCGRPEESIIRKECSMCGDIGIFEDLFQCKKCVHRYQHIYCSRSYPNLGSEMWVCNWCLHAEGKSQQQEENEEKPKLKRSLGEGRNNAFEFLLQIAQSLPETGCQEDKIQQPSISKGTDIIGSQVPKRQRCNHVAEKSRVIALDRWRQMAKNRLQLNPPRGIGRRYKLLADVLC